MQIRRSAGKLHGMWLAVFDGLLPLLLALVFLQAGGAAASTSGPVVSVLVVAVILTGQIIASDRGLEQGRRMQEAAGVRAESSMTFGQLHEIRRQTKRGMAVVAVATLSNLLGAYAHTSAAGTPAERVLSLVLAGGAILMALPLRRQPAGITALFMATLALILYPLMGRQIDALKRSAAGPPPALTTPTQPPSRR
jgi:hypothetical protein